MPTTKTTKNRSVHELRFGRLRAAIWANQAEQGIWHNVTLSRLYKEGNDWKDSTNFGRDDLPLLALVIDQAFLWIHQQGANGKEAAHDR